MKTWLSEAISERAKGGGIQSEMAKEVLCIIYILPYSVDYQWRTVIGMDGLKQANVEARIYIMGGYEVSNYTHHMVSWLRIVLGDTLID